MIILALDPGFEKVGYSIFEKKVNGKITATYITSGLIRTNKSDVHAVRLMEIYNQLKTFIDLYRPDLIVMEQLFFFKNATTVIGVAQAQGVMQLLAAQVKIPMKLLTPPQIKEIITGYGNADKKAVRKMLDLQLKEKIDYLDDDQSDAVACGLAYCYINEKLI